MGYIDSGGYSSGASANYAVDENGKITAWNDPRTAVIRSKTFPGIAQAMARQWSAHSDNIEVSTSNEEANNELQSRR